MSQQSHGGFRDRLRNWFPDREFFMRSEGQMRFIKVSSRAQITAAGIAVGALSVWFVSMAAAGFLQYQAEAERASLLDREAQVASSESRMAAYGDDIATIAQDLEQRQDVLDELIKMLPDDVNAEQATVSDSSGESSELISMVQDALPEAEGLARIEARQLAFVERLTLYADQRSAMAERAIRSLGLNPQTMLDSSDDAVGGPLEALVSGVGTTLDPRFERLGLSLARLSAYERGLAGIPQVMPADAGSISSGFGYRRDPFTGGGAMHSGLDFRAPHGSPIRAAAAGVVSFAGVKSGYGLVVEIDHGSGIITRYAHMSRFSTMVGAEVEAGALIGAIGNTGRSTGPHLHFEVRINDRAVNPRPFLESAPHVLEEVRSQFRTGRNEPHGHARH